MAEVKTPVVIKVGGALLENPQIAGQLLGEIKALQSLRPVILVHGGGPLVETLLAAMQLTSTKIDGLRVTPDEQMPYVCGALAGSANKSLCGLAIGAGITPVGLSLMDGGITQCKVLDEKYGAVGVPSVGKADLLNQLLSASFLPVISSIGSNSDGRLLNVNADQAATVIAELMGGDLLLLSNVDGVLDQDKQLIKELDQSRIDEEVAKGVIKDGMLVKVAAAMQAASELAKPVTIANWSAPLTAILNNQTGTRVIPASQTSGA
ncbi:acetylglutamate kinase [Alteromonas lipolytica]|uniref:Acetylglutamate kinase n=1 Tax=Alteromonas lipolytica TaxID=1856405 RepID=A0A1E8FBG4_9ALTE|nr:acetylglutamate kinase [Alteromonas lipolytica]OFI33249.1 acetylglutamate kinase [Alteromonas lipolytica]GGF61333.1 acetylglutamate kinase [Alteromonas lipolytica]